jgi:hypothetical protein
MTASPAKPSSINNSRCQHRYAHNKRCRLSITNLDSAFCPIHSRLPVYETDSAEVAAALTDNLSEFRSAIPINDFLSRVLLLLARNRISTRKAAVLTFTCSQLLRTLPVIDRELNPPDGDKAPTIIFDIPRPQRFYEPARIPPGSTEKSAHPEPQSGASTSQHVSSQPASSFASQPAAPQSGSAQPASLASPPQVVSERAPSPNPLGSAPHSEPFSPRPSGAPIAVPPNLRSTPQARPRPRVRQPTYTNFDT